MKIKYWNKMNKRILIVCIVLFASLLSANMKLARLHYSGGGDWYNNPEVLPNLAKFANEKLGTRIALEESIVELNDANLADYPFLYITGHGKIKFSKREREGLRSYLDNGGFLYVDDDFGLDKSFRVEMKALFPERELVELPKEHEIFSSFYKFPQGTPKIHKHDEKRPQTFAIYDDYGRIVVIYTFETNISDGWADPSTHKDSEATRQKAFKMGTNILNYILTR